MADEPFLLISLKDDKTKKLAQVISNDTCKKILEFLADKKKATETDISKEMKLPLSTIHYNLSNLVDAKLVKTDEFHYSEKGKTVNHYSLANKFIIIAPAEEKEGFVKKLKSILPAFVGVSMISVGIALYQSFSKGLFSTQASFKAAESFDTAPRLMAAAEQTIVQTPTEPNIALWFFIGATATIAIYLLWNLVYSKFQKR